MRSRALRQRWHEKGQFLEWLIYEIVEPVLEKCGSACFIDLVNLSQWIEKIIGLILQESVGEPKLLIVGRRV